jgi:hypothetical protein
MNLEDGRQAGERREQRLFVCINCREITCFISPSSDSSMLALDCAKLDESTLRRDCCLRELQV